MQHNKNVIPRRTKSLKIPDDISKTVTSKESESSEEIKNEKITDIFEGDLKILTFSHGMKKYYKEYYMKVYINENDNNEIKNISFVLKSHEDIFFCMKAEFNHESYNEELNMKNLIISYEDIPSCLLEIFKSVQNDENLYILIFHNDVSNGLLKIVQNLENLRVDLLDIKFESLSDDELDQLGQLTYSQILNDLSLTKKKFEVSIAELLKKNPRVLKDVMLNAEDSIHNHEERSRLMGKVFEENERYTSAYVKHNFVNEADNIRRLPYKCQYLDQFERDWNGNVVYVDDRGQKMYTSTGKFNNDGKLTQKLT